MNSGITARLKQNDEFECQTCLSHETDTGNKCQNIKLNGQFFDIRRSFIFVAQLGQTFLV